MKYNFNQFIDDLAKASGQYALCEAVKKGYKVCCEGRQYALGMSGKFNGVPYDETGNYTDDKKNFAKTLAGLKQSSNNNEPFQFDKPYLFASRKDVDENLDSNESSMYLTPKYKEMDYETIPDTGKHEDSIANIRKTMDYAVRLAEDKYGLHLIAREVKCGKPDYPYIRYELEGSSIDSSLADGPDGTYDKYVELANDLAKLGFEHETFYHGNWDESYTNHRYTYWGRYNH